MEEEAEYGFIVNVDAQGSGLLSDTEKPGMRRRLPPPRGGAEGGEHGARRPAQLFVAVPGPGPILRSARTG